jgi:hypothetical protein
MKGDFSRIRFEKNKHYTAVLEQQGRVDLDADANEQRAIDLTLRETINTDVIGRYGAPEFDAGFAINIDNSNHILIGPGRYYVDGILCENKDWVDYDSQPYLIGTAQNESQLINQLSRAAAGSTLGLVLEVWQRLVTPLDDPCLLEPALGQADTTARLQTVWRVVGSINPASTAAGNIQPGDPIGQLPPCCQALYQGTSAQHGGKMGAGLNQAGSDCGCQPIAAAGYQGLENQLYRVEIHNPGDINTATFKWSRENGSVLASVTSVAAGSPIITVSTLGPDANLGFQPGQWVELSDDTYQFGDTPNQHGLLFQIQSVAPATMQVTMTTPVFGIDTTQNARMRRWDQAGASAASSGIHVSGTPIPLENGIQVDFKGGPFQTGDYWTVPARTANGQIDWPPCGGDGDHFQSAGYIRIHRAPLACVALRTAVRGKPASRFAINDCRLLFPPLTSVNAANTAAALHVSATSWTNDDIMTVDTMLLKGVSVTFDQPTTCPWGGGNFQVTLEPPFGGGDAWTRQEGNLPGIPKPTFGGAPSTDSFLRTVLELDPPFGITVTGNQVFWLLPPPTGGTISNTGASVGGVDYALFELLPVLNGLLSWQNFIGYGRVRVRLIGGAIYGSGTSGNMYLDGQSLGQTFNRAMDNSPAVRYNVPSGGASAVSDFEGWFYLAPSLVITNVVIQGTSGANVIPVSAIKVIVDFNNNITGFQIGETQTVTNLQATVTLSYPPVAPIAISLVFSGPGAGTIVTIAGSVTAQPGQTSFTTPINVIANPGAGVKDTVTLTASVPSAIGAIPAAQQPTLTITGMAPPIKPPA